nr:uncharacterized protein LOC124212249 [Neodiprion pinetum]
MHGIRPLPRRKALQLAEHPDLVHQSEDTVHLMFSSAKAKCQPTQNILGVPPTFHVVTGEKVKPTQFGQEVLAKAWVKDDACAKVVISTSIDDSQLQPLLSCATSKEMWDMLLKAHEQKSTMNVLLSTQKFHEYRIASSDSVVQHFAKVSNMAAQLKDVGKPVSQITLIAKILANLAPKYANFLTAWDSVDPGRQILDNLQERLIREELRNYV